MKKKVFIWGATPSIKQEFDEIVFEYEVIGFIDNNADKIGGKLFNIPIYGPNFVNNEIYKIFILSISGCDSIIEQLEKMGISKEKIDKYFVEYKVIPRINFLKNLSLMFETLKLNEAVSEVGVFQGDFAQKINKYFKEQRLYLFDSFEGFDEKDIVYEKRNNLSNSKANHLSNTSEQVVYAKMPYKDKVKIIKGYFPESVKDSQIPGRFMFVNIDLDLYKPTYEGLKYFQDKIVKNGVILVHDYFNSEYSGVEKAVKEFLKITNEFSVMPIGDMCSIALIKR
ncbi:TylF/MycF/NovP-related O-methyltransferase [Lysinibacillus sp. NPDC047702]|uniref:TylF/MycF/NovP-related O-methyltransferase n=1 Tax=unclassified Lysinibacillus TaxID=2636778 RepID=UPI003D005405